ncbi:MAG: hypothetical protein IKH57_25085 [Clostridia bacterium]|nr:hypothetical protein [Clostridia bacterium]MBR6860325.1 hypothetical protein [Acidaminococcaceae bacterium]
MVISKKYVFLLVNFAMMTGIMFSVTDSSLADFGTKFKYVFILYCLVDVLSHKKRPCSRNVALLFSLLLFYVLAWGFVFKNPVVAAQIAAHRKTMLIYQAMLILCALEVIHYKCVEEYALTSGAALCLVLVVQVASHRNEMIFNPVFAIRSFLAHDLVRSSFGFLDTNFVGNSCFLILCILFMVYLFRSDNPRFHSRIRILLVLAGLVVFYIMLNTSSRTPMICLLAFAGGAAVIRLLEHVHLSQASVKLAKRYAALAILILPVLFWATGLWDYIWIRSNRALNVSANVQWVPIIGNIWTGMGFVENGAFITDASNNWISAFGVATSSLDMNYLYLYCTTGILGCAVMAAILLILGIGLYKNRKEKYGYYYILLYIVILFYAFMETILFTYRFWAMLIPYVILFYGANKECGE